MRISTVAAAAGSLLLLAAHFPRKTAPAKSSAAPQSLFNADLYRELADANDGNFFFSPNSVSAALTMTLAGTRGSTATELANALHLKGDLGPVHSAFGSLLKDLNGNGKTDRGFRLAVANAIWTAKDLTFGSLTSCEGPGLW